MTGQLLTEHQHDWVRTGVGTHFPIEPNSRRRPRAVHKLRCLGCDHRGYRYDFSRVVYTWNPADAVEEAS